MDETLPGECGDRAQSHHGKVVGRCGIGAPGRREVVMIFIGEKVAYRYRKEESVS